MTDYVDARDLSPEHTTIPCKECGESFYVTASFAYNHDEWYCRACKPDHLAEIHGTRSRVVRL